MHPKVALNCKACLIAAGPAAAAATVPGAPLRKSTDEPKWHRDEDDKSSSSAASDNKTNKTLNDDLEVCTRFPASGVPSMLRHVKGCDQCEVGSRSRENRWGKEVPWFGHVAFFHKLECMRSST